MKDRLNDRAPVWALWLVFLAGFFVVSAAHTDAVGQPTVNVRQVEGIYAGELVVPINKSQILQVDSRFKRVSIGNAEVADVIPLTDRAVYVLGKKLGITNLVVFAAGDRPIAVVDINVSYDVQGLKEKLHEVYPGEPVEVRAGNGGIVLGGSVSGAGTAAGVLNIAQQYAGDRVVNLLGVSGSQQVMLEVQFAEVNRSVSRQLGIRTDAFNPNSLDIGVASIPVGGLPAIDAASIASIFGAPMAQIGKIDFHVLIEALERKGALRRLAEPTLMAMSGDTASFLAGGEFPVPVARSNDSEDGEGSRSITVAFKEFGVGLSFTPTVLDDGLINLMIEAEESQLDDSASVVTAGFNIPGISTRRASTTVELKDGQSFTIAGLLQNNFSDNVDQLPWLGDVPILGSLFRSSDFQSSETELVIIVTPRLVKPAEPGQLALPIDNFVEPNDIDLFLFGRTQGSAFDLGQASVGRVLDGDTARGGLSGSHGHIIQ